VEPVIILLAAYAITSGAERLSGKFKIV
jgi:hypothetical protein